MTDSEVFFLVFLKLKYINERKETNLFELIDLIAFLFSLVFCTHKLQKDFRPRQQIFF